MDEKEIYLTAIRLIEEHGEKAWDESVVKYFERKERADEESMALWRRIGHAVNKLNETISPGPLH